MCTCRGLSALVRKPGLLIMIFNVHGPGTILGEILVQFQQSCLHSPILDGKNGRSIYGTAPGVNGMDTQGIRREASPQGRPGLGSSLLIITPTNALRGWSFGFGFVHEE